MPTTLKLVAASAILLAVCPWPASSQTFDTVGTRAAGMSGAFVAVADDASAVYWNPAGLAAGALFSFVADRIEATADPSDSVRAGSRSGAILALGAPALGLSYTRLRRTMIAEAQPTAGVAPGRNGTGTGARLDTLVSHHAGATLVQSLAQGIAVGATLKVVRGVAGQELRTVAGLDRVLDDAAALVGRASNRFDADLGLMITGPRLRVGVTVRNLTEPSFEAAGVGAELTLERQARAGVAFAPVEGWMVALDLDLLRTATTVGGEGRDLAIGTEGRLGPRAFVRAGTRFDTIGDGPGGRSATGSFGASYAVLGSLLVDAQVTLGSKWAGRGWGVGARFVY